MRTVIKSSTGQLRLNDKSDDFYKLHLKEGIRPDGRMLMEMRPMVLNVGSISTASGSSLVKVGNTTVVCGIKAELTEPNASHPGKGIVVPNVELSPLCSPKFKPGPPCDQAQVVTKFLDNLIQSTNLICLDDLCVENDKLVWILYCDLICIDYDGNIVDASVISLMAALQNVKLPEVKINEECESVEVNLKCTATLKLCSCPVSTTFRVFDRSNIIADPTSMEEELTEGQLTIVTDQQGRIIYMERPGGVTLQEEHVEKCMKRAVIRGAEVQTLYMEVTG
uniref:Ribosomal RNA-processing protein 43 n=1 Tax=Phallusia mammillata TaxID=59560 RepID=A0A6F9DCY2_9ASCI|nr:exosome complex component RRP43-like [Phallusia mammillata]